MPTQEGRNTGGGWGAWLIPSGITGRLVVRLSPRRHMPPGADYHVIVIKDCAADLDEQVCS
jgi:hypothetical protein